MTPAFLPRRELGRTRFVATRLGIGDLADRAVGFDDCVATLRRALDAGLNVVDTAPSYEDGYSEEIVGAALRGRRDGVFVVDKIDHLDRPVAPQLAESLKRLGLAAVDLVVFHGLSDIDAWRRVVARGGLMDELGEEARAGRCRFRGVSSHHPDVLAEAIASGTCDVVMFPIGPWVDERYEREILPAARARGVGSICFKTFGAGKLVADTEGYGRPLTSGARDLPRLSAAECVRYTLTRDPDVALLGLSSPAEQDEAFAAAAAFGEPLAEPQLTALRERARAAIAGKGRCWWNPSGA